MFRWVCLDQCSVASMAAYSAAQDLMLVLQPTNTPTRSQSIL
jgi:hypothetical protein